MYIHADADIMTYIYNCFSFLYYWRSKVCLQSLLHWNYSFLSVFLLLQYQNQLSIDLFIFGKKYIIILIIHEFI